MSSTDLHSSPMTSSVTNHHSNSNNDKIFKRPKAISHIKSVKVFFNFFFLILLGLCIIYWVYVLYTLLCSSFWIHKQPTKKKQLYFKDILFLNKLLFSFHFIKKGSVRICNICKDLPFYSIDGVSFYAVFHTILPS